MRRLCIRLCARCEHAPLSPEHSFVMDVIQDNPKSCFRDVVLAWHRYIQQPSSRQYDTAESQLLNTKLNDFLSPFLGHRQNLYSTAHFAAELGSTVLLELLSSHGVMLHAKADGKNTTQVQVDSYVHTSLDDVAVFYPDGEGRYLAHLAALHGHVSTIAFLVDRLGAEHILSQRQASPRSSPMPPVGSLDVFETAFVYGHAPLLEWIDTFHPYYAFNSMDVRVLGAVRRAGAFGQRPALEYLLKRHGEPARVVLRGAMYPAAEAGEEGLLAWLSKVIGAEVVWLPDEDGATALHHAARFGRVELLDGFFSKHDLWRHVDDRDALGRTPAMWCVMGGRKPHHIAFMRRLLELGSIWPRDVDDKGRDVETLARLQNIVPRASMLRFIASCKKR